MLCAALDAWDAACTAMTSLMRTAASPSAASTVQDPTAPPYAAPPLASHAVEDVGSPPLGAPQPTRISSRSNNPFSSSNDLTMLQGADTALQQELQTLRATLDDVKTQHAQQMAAMRGELEGSVATMRAQVSALRAQLADERRRAEEGTRRIAELTSALHDTRDARDALQTRVRCVAALVHAFVSLNASAPGSLMKQQRPSSSMWRRWRHSCRIVNSPSRDLTLLSSGRCWREPPSGASAARVVGHGARWHMQTALHRLGMGCHRARQQT